jgi:hypothetical protein
MPAAKLTAACSGSVGCAVGITGAAALNGTTRAGAITNAGFAAVVRYLTVVDSTFCTAASRVSSWLDILLAARHDSTGMTFAGCEQCSAGMLMTLEGHTRDWRCMLQSSSRCME